jgi:hypothetical protein
MNTRSLTLPIAAAAAAVGLAVACVHNGSRPPTTTGPSTTSRDHGVAEHSADVMPFDITKATHTFTPTSEGLVETVTNNAPVDAAQVALIRGHLAMEATAFAAGNFDDPARIHGGDMPGLAELRAGATHLTIAYTDVADGGRITYTTSDPALVDALHRFGAAQSADHGHEQGNWSGAIPK